MTTKRIPNATLELYAKKALKKLLLRLPQVKPLKRFLPASELGVGPGAELVVDLTVCSPAKMQAINLQFRDQDKSTDVLSFPASEFFWNQGVLGDLVLCGSVLIEQAREQKHSWQNEVEVLIVHGLLHLLGFDHEVDAAEAKRMAKMEELVFGVKKSAPVKSQRGLIARARVVKKKVMKARATQ